MESKSNLKSCRTERDLSCAHTRNNLNINGILSDAVFSQVVGLGSWSLRWHSEVV